MRACLYLWVERPLGGATLEERLVGLQEGVLDHHHRNFRSRRRVHDPQNIGEVSLGVGDGQRTRKIFILHIDDYERSFHMSLPLVPLIFSRDSTAFRALLGTPAYGLHHPRTMLHAYADCTLPAPHDACRYHDGDVAIS